MIIQHNIPAMNAHRFMGLNNKGINGNLEKLSSGYKVNRAADDAAGLAISEKMRGQIRGLAMAEQNTSQGINLIQTAEGGLNETHAILQRMRELAVQSSNGTFQNEDRDQLTKEFNALKNEINRIASSTHYNGIKLLDGSLSNGKVYEYVEIDDITAEPKPELVVGDTITPTDGTIVTADLDGITALSVEIGEDGKGTVALTGSTVATLGATAELKDGVVTVTFTNSANSNTGSIAFDVADAVVGDTFKLDITGLDAASDTLTDLVAGKTGADVTIERTEPVVTPTVEYEDAENPTAAISKYTATGAPAAATFTGTGFSIEFDDTGAVVSAAVTGGSVGTSAQYKANSATIADNKLTLVLESEANAANYVTLEFDLEGFEPGQGFTLDFDLTAADLGSTAYVTNPVVTNAKQVKEADTDEAEGGSLVFQIGANGGQDQRVKLQVENMSAENLGLRLNQIKSDGKAATAEDIGMVQDTSIKTIKEANKAIEIIHAATNQVSGQRAKLGALQNRMESALNSLGISKENLTAAESTIRDTDMAKEMMEFTKNNILVQASQAMLAQANQLPQGVLQLLR